jgi:hypothetical protein
MISRLTGQDHSENGREDSTSFSSAFSLTLQPGKYNSLTPAHHGYSLFSTDEPGNTPIEELENRVQSGFCLRKRVVLPFLVNPANSLASEWTSNI